jgi:hypothetical protein
MFSFYFLCFLHFPTCFATKPVVPRHVFHALYEPKVSAEVVDDICIIVLMQLG